MKKLPILIVTTAIGTCVIVAIAFNTLIGGLIFARLLSPPTPHFLINVKPGSWSDGIETRACEGVAISGDGKTDLRERIGLATEIGADGRDLARKLAKQGFVPYRWYVDNKFIHAMKFIQTGGNVLQTSPVEAIVVWNEDVNGNIIASCGSVNYRYEGP